MSNNKAVIRRLSTGIAGLDNVLGGGVPEFSFTLIAGAPGSGKTILAHQIMFGMATPARTALYFTVLGEPPLKMLRYQQQFEYFDSEKVNASIRFVSLSEESASGDLGRVLSRIDEETRAHSPRLVFVDSFRSLVQSSQNVGASAKEIQHFVQNLGMLMTSWEATTFLIGEYSTDPDSGPVFTIADGLIWLRQSVERNSVVRKLEVSKMRGQATLPGLHTFRISDGGIKVFAPARLRAMPAVSENATLGPARMGVAGLDEMLGGGLPRGYSMLVAGPSGSGKSILASAFLVEGARAGETGVIAAFEQSSGRLRDPAIEALVAEGRVGIIDTASSELSVDEIAAELIREIHRLKATRLVIDSLSGFELALAPTFQTDYREALARMVFALAGTGVTLLMTSELEDRYSELRFSPYGTAFLTDAIVVHRYVGIDGRLERMMAVVKLRARGHSNELRLFRIDDAGITVGARIAGHEGLLGNSPTLAHEP